MAQPVKPLVAGNWKMNGLKRSATEFGRIVQGAGNVLRNCDLLVCPPATLIATFAGFAPDSAVRVGAQDCHAQSSGAFTGDLSAEMLRDAGATSVIVGHSERRALHGETDAAVMAKAQAAWRAGLVAIVCVGETRQEREAGQTLSVIGRQFDGSVPDGATPDKLLVAYEPVWAIGTGLTPTVADVAEVHRSLRERLTAKTGASGAQVRILYGGSVKPSNARELLSVEHVNGALVGGASLKADEFLAIAAAYT